MVWKLYWFGPCCSELLCQLFFKSKVMPRLPAVFMESSPQHNRRSYIRLLMTPASSSFSSAFPFLCAYCFRVGSYPSLVRTCENSLLGSRARLSNVIDQELDLKCYQLVIASCHVMSLEPLVDMCAHVCVALASIFSSPSMISRFQNLTLYF